MEGKENRLTIINLYNNGNTPREIIRITKIPQRTVYDAIKRYKELGTSLDRPRTGRPLTAITPDNINKVRCRISRNPERSMREMAKQLNISNFSMRKICHDILKLPSYKLRRCQYLSDKMKKDRFKKCHFF